jgi:hypothetical protein
VASEGKHSQEFRRYRQGLIAFYLAIVAAGGALLVASVVWQLAVPSSAVRTLVDPENPPVTADDPDAEALLHCHADLSALLHRLGESAGELLSTPPTDGRAEVGSVWNERSQMWRADYDALGARCRFPELAAAQRRAALQRMAEIYAELPAMHRTYQQILQQFDDQLAGELARKRRALDRSREALLRRHRAAPPP